MLLCFNFVGSLGSVDNFKVTVMIIFFAFLKFLWNLECSKSERRVFNTKRAK